MSQTQTPVVRSAHPLRKEYRAPRLTSHGDAKKLTQHRCGEHEHDHEHGHHGPSSQLF